MKLHDTLIDLLDEARSRDRELRLINGENDESVVRFPDIWDRALALLGSLQARGMRPGDELVVFSRSNLDFVVAFWAAMLGGIVPVPVAVGISDEHRFKLFRILKQLERGTLFTEMDLLQRLLDFSKSQGMDDISTILESRTVLMNDVTPSNSGVIHDASADDLAFIQYSSGSTSDPKGVCLTHANLCTNIRAIIEGLHWTEDDRSLSWMPLTHDMGLIGYHLSVLAAGMSHAVMDTNVFVRRPLLWMSKASELRATQLCSPNFGYKHFLKLFGRKGLPEYKRRANFPSPWPGGPAAPVPSPAPSSHRLSPGPPRPRAAARPERRSEFAGRAGIPQRGRDAALRGRTAKGQGACVLLHRMQVEQIVAFIDKGTQFAGSLRV